MHINIEYRALKNMKHMLHNLSIKYKILHFDREAYCIYCISNKSSIQSILHIKQVKYSKYTAYQTSQVLEEYYISNVSSIKNILLFQTCQVLRANCISMCQVLSILLIKQRVGLL